ncbi:hypothetical protein FHW13_000115 [Dokdonella fugitiva]|jgi:hypothetical protein|nr:hypothetical protein [Dokdonella fugitiva]
MRRSALSFLLVVSTTCAAWTPEWTSTWQHPEPQHGTTAAAMLRGPDGAVFAALHVAHHGTGHATLARFAADGGFEWLREDVGGGTIAMTLLDDARIALVDGDIGDASPIHVRVHDAASGDVIWSDATRTGRYAPGATRIARSAGGDLLVATSSGGEVVVLRYTAAGTPLPDWRWSSGQATISVDDMLALPDGGAIVAARGVAIGGGYLAVRFDAGGTVVFTGREDGELGNPLGLARVAGVDDGYVFAGAPESTFGVPKALLWKVRADGTRAWTRAAPNADADRSSLDVGGLVAHAGDVFAVVHGPGAGGFRLLRLDAADGAVREDARAAVEGVPTRLVRGAGGRLLVGGFDLADSMGHVAARIAEFDAGGRPCRSSDALGYASEAVPAADVDGWLTLGTGAWQAGSSDALVSRYDADGACDGDDAIFTDGFDPSARASSGEGVPQASAMNAGRA